MTEPRRRPPLALGADEGLPFSKGLLARSMMAAGVAADRAYELALGIEADLAATGRQAVDVERLHELAVERLGEEEGERVVRRLRRYRELYELDLPIVLLVGGATGTGKSSVATEVAYRLGITRVTSTDFVRQTMRAFFSKEFMPSIHYSSFEVGRATVGSEDETSDPVVAGFLEQTRNVLVGVQAAIDRALHEGWSMVLEGVHLVPGMLPGPIEGALVVQCVLAIDDAEEHASHFWSRDVTSDHARPFAKYLDALDDIRVIQDHIVDRARRIGVPVIDNGNMEAAVGTVMELVLSQAEQVQAVQT